MIAEITLQVINDKLQGIAVRDCYYIPVVGISYDNVDEYMSYGF